MLCVISFEEVLNDGAALCDDEVAVDKGGRFAQGLTGAANARFEIRRGETIWCSVGTDESIGKIESLEEKGYADRARGIEEKESYVWRHVRLQ